MTLLFGMIAFSCSAPQNPWTSLNSPPGTSYVVQYQLLGDRGYGDTPFKIRIFSRNNPQEVENLIQTGQCKGVKVGLSTNLIYLFYDEIEIREFSSYSYIQNAPEVIICNIRERNCKTAYFELMNRGRYIADLCTLPSEEGGMWKKVETLSSGDTMPGR
jgi:hypothetical protein